VIILTTRPGDGGRGAERNAAFVFLLILCIQSSRADIFRLRLLSWSAIYPSRYITCGWGARWEESNRHRHPPLSTPPFHLSPSSSIFCSQTFLPNHNPPQKPQNHKPQTTETMSTTTITTTPPAVSPPTSRSAGALSSAALEEHHHLRHLRRALTLAWQCTPIPSAFCVGAVLLSSSGTVLSTGYSRELPDNTHAEQVALTKLGSPPPEGSVLYTTMEPCMKRLSGEKSCVERIVDAGGIGTVVVGVKEPNTFVQGNQAQELLEAKGIRYLYVPGLEREILVVAERSHKKEE